MEKPIIIKLPDCNNWMNDFTKIIWHIKKFYKGQVVILDMINFKFINPQGMLLLVLVCSLIYNITGIPVQFTNLSVSIMQYLERMNFFNFNFAEQGKVGFLYKWIRSTQSQNLIELTYLTSPYPCLSEVVNKLKNILDNRIFLNKNDDLCSTIITMITEMCNNAFEHSIFKKETDINKFGTCYLLAQVYTGDNKNEVDIAIGDLGIGIRRSLGVKYDWVYPSDTKMIYKVLDGLSGRMISDSGGRGIPFVRNAILNDFKGEFSLRTGKGLIKYDTENKFTDKEYDYEFPGTQWSIRLQYK